MNEASMTRILARRRVTRADRLSLLLRCDACGMGFAPLIKPGGRLYRRFWQCPNGCNADEQREGV